MSPKHARAPSGIIALLVQKEGISKVMWGFTCTRNTKFWEAPSLQARDINPIHDKRKKENLGQLPIFSFF
jgi:hypothetical protein